MKMNMDISGKRKLGAMLLLFGMAIVILVVQMMNKRPDNVEPEPPAAVIDIQDPETSEPERSKIRAYRSSDTSKAGRMWDELEEDMDDPYRKEDVDASPARSATPDEMYGNITSNAGAGSEGTSSGRERLGGGGSVHGGTPKPGDPDYRAYRMKQYYDNTDATVRRGEAVKDSIRNASPADHRSEEPMAVIGDSLPVRRSTAMSTIDSSPGQGFSSLTDDDSIPADSQYPFECMFVRAEKLRDGARVSVRLLEDMVVGGTVIPKNTHLMAMCSIKDRLELNISSVEMNSRIYQLGYEAYDTDGGRGIYCPDLGGDTKRSIQSRGISSVGRVIGGRMARLASEAVQAGVSVAQTKTGEVTVSVPSGYRFFIVRKQRQ